MPTQTIRSRDGRVLYTGEAATKKAFLVDLVRKRQSLAHADLHNVNLSYVDISGGDFRNADLSNAILKGSTATDTLFDGALMNGVRAEGMSARSASFRSASIGKGQHGPATFAGSILTYSDFSDSRHELVSFDGAGLTGTCWRRAISRRCTFSSSWFTNADHTKAEYVDCDFSGARMKASPVSSRIPVESMPDRTRKTVAIGNRYGNVSFDPSVRAFRSDQRSGRIERGICWSVSTAAILTGTGLLENVSQISSLTELATGVVGTGIAFMAMTAVGGFVGERLNDVVKDVIDSSMTGIQRFVRSTLSGILREGGRLKDMTVAFLLGPGVSEMARFLTCEENGRPSPIAQRRHKAFRNCTVVLARKDRIAACLQSIGDFVNGKTETGSDLLIVRQTFDANAPIAMKYFSNGGLAAFYGKKGSITGFTGFDHLGRAIATRGRVPPNARPVDVRRSFERALLMEMGAPADFTYPFDTHELAEGRDGSIVVVESGRSLPANLRDGYVIIRPDGTAYKADDAKVAAKVGYDHAPAPSENDDDLELAMRCP